MKSGAKLCETEKASLILIKGLLRPLVNKISGKSVCVETI